MSASARELNRASLARQLLLRREPLDPVDGVRRVVAIQAQEPVSAYLALWNRLVGFDAGALDRALSEYALVRATLMRMTLHLVHATDYPAFHEAMQPTLRASRLNDRRFRQVGLSVEEVDALLPAVLEFAARPRTNAEIEAFIADRFGGPLPDPGAWWAIRTYGPFLRAPAEGPWSFRPRPTYIAAPHLPRQWDGRAALAALVRRYLEGFGPASVGDVARFALVQRPRVREALADLGDLVVRLDGPDGRPLFDVRDGIRPAAETAAPPRLLPMWDSLLLAYADGGRIVPPEYRPHVTRRNGDVLPTLLVDGYVAGVWRPIDGAIEATAFHRLDDEAWAGLEAEARAMLVLLQDREPSVYRRHWNWWASLPAAEVRTLGA